jgi:hypothetical protein
MINNLVPTLVANIGGGGS